MFAQKQAKCIEAGSLAASYLEGQEQVQALSDGSCLRAAATSVLSQLPSGPLTLVSTSTAGAALAATCAALRSEPTHWQAIDLLLPTPIEGAVAVVEPIDAGDGWRGALTRHYPGAEVFLPRAAGDLELAA
jgi:hypothetical protein